MKEYMYESEFEALGEINTHLQCRGDDATRLRGISEILERIMGYRHASLLLMSATGEALVFEGHNDTESPVEYKRGEGIIGRVLQTGQSEIIPLISEEPEFLGRIHEREVNDAKEYGFVCVPVSITKETVGAIAADVPSKNNGLGGDEQFLNLVASMIAHNVKLRRESNILNSALRKENQRLRSQIGDLQPQNMIGCSGKMRSVYQNISQVAESNTTVLIRGESGTGKELVAAAVHYNSARSNHPFVKVNCAALSENLLESELFGHEKGAFTGALQNRKGRIAEAEGGTLFLDEIGDFAPTIQVKMLRLLQEREYSVVGSNEVKKANVRFIAATNRDLEQTVQEGTFRQDLYYRINVFPIYIPSLKERKEDILPLANHFVEKHSESTGTDIRRISTTAINMLCAYHWPGNVRELENCIQHAMLMCKSDVLQGSDLPPTLAMPVKNENESTRGSMKDKVLQLEMDLLTDSLKKTNGNIAAAARLLSITPRIARYKCKQYGILINK